MGSEMSYFLIWSQCIKRLVHRAVYCIILVLSLVLFMQSLYTLSNILNFSFTCIRTEPEGINCGQSSNMETAAVRLYFLLEHNYSLVILHVIWI